MKHLKKIKGKPLSYDHMQGNPLDPANHPSASLPEPTGGMFNGEQPYQNLSPPSNAIDYDNSAG